MNEMEKDTTLIMMDESVWKHFRRVLSGLRAPKDSGEYKFAQFETMRFLSSWGISIGISLAVILVLITFAVGQAVQKEHTVEVVVLQTESVQLDPEIKAEIEKLQQETEVPTDVAMETPLAQEMPVETALKIESAPVSTPMMSKSPLILKGMPGAMSNRGSAQARASAMKEFSGTREGEDAVMRTLRWLKKTQDPDGSWETAETGKETDKKKGVDLDRKNAMAGLALLCFLAHGETPESAEFGETVEKAMKYIVASQNPTNGLFSKVKSPSGVIAYSHAICTYAVSEGYALTKIMALKMAMDKGIDVIIKGQNKTGGFDYKYSLARNRWDLSVGGWQFQAMKAAKMAGSTHPGLEKAIKLGINHMRKEAFSAKRGGFGYAWLPGDPVGDHSSVGMTGVGVLCLQLLGEGDVPEARAGLEYLQNKLPLVEWKPVGKNELKEGSKGPNSIYAWYYVTQAKFQKGGKVWEEWNAMFPKVLIRAQDRDGFWIGGDHGGPVYTTTLACLALEVYYRYLPTYKQTGSTPAAAPLATSVEDVVVDVK